MRILYGLVPLCLATTVFAQTAPTETPPSTPAPEAPAQPAAPATSETPAAPAVPAAPAAPPAWTQPVAPSLEQIPPMQPLAGYANGSFFLRDPHDWFVLFPKGRLQVDWFNFLNRGDVPAGVVPNSSADPRPKDTVFVRRARIELQGTFIGHFDFHIAGEFTTTPAAGSLGGLADAYIIADYLSWLKVQVGQFDAPFSLENRTSDKYLDLMERSTAVRYLAVPFNKDMGGFIWGWLPKNVAYYSIGVVNGDGQNFKNQDNWGTVLGRGVVYPLAWMPQADKWKWLNDIEVGASFWWQHEANLGGAIAGASSGTQNDLTAMSTLGGFSFFGTNYNVGTDGNGNNIREHLVPSGSQVKWGVEARIPWWKFGFQGELIHVNEDLFSYFDSVNIPNAMTGKWSGAPFARSTPKVGGNLEGFGGYAELFGWILGDVNFLETPGIEPMPHIKKFTPARQPIWGLRLVARYEEVTFNVRGLPGFTSAATGTTTLDQAVGLTRLRTFALGFDAWGTKHVRLTVNYLYNFIDGDSANVKGNYFFNRGEHELMFRAGINL